MIRVIDKHYKTACGEDIHEYLIDKDSELQDLPKCPAGSYAISVESGTKYYCNNSGEWPKDPSKYNTGGGGGASSWDDLKNKPFEVLKEAEAVLPETTIQMEVGEDGTSVGAIIEPLEVEAGKEYKVVWCGDEYKCTAQPFFMEGVNVAIIGDLGLATGGVSTGGPFLMIIFPAEAGMGGQIMDFTGKTEISVAIYGDEVIKKLDNKFLDLEWLPSPTGEVELAAERIVSNSNSNNKLTEITKRTVYNGQKLIVYLDGERYECTVIALADDFIYAGSMPYAGDSSFPFSLLIDGNNTTVSILNSSGEHTISVNIYEYKKLPAETMPTSAILCTKQTLTNSQKAQARENIGANVSGFKTYIVIPSSGWVQHNNNGYVQEVAVNGVTSQSVVIAQGYMAGSVLSNYDNEFRRSGCEVFGTEQGGIVFWCETKLDYDLFNVHLMVFN